MTAPSSTSTIFVGSSLDLEGLSLPSIADPLLADGDVGLYGHMSGIINSYIDGTESSVVSTWAGTGAGLVEITQDEPMAIMAVTIANTGNTALTFPIGQIVSSAGGVQYQIVQKPRQETGWSLGGAGDGTLGTYTIQPGQSLTLLAQALVDGPSGNLLANQVTKIAIPGAVITGSTLVTAAPQWAAGTLTLSNHSGVSQIIYQTMAVTGANGDTYQVGVDPTVHGFVATDSDASGGYYVLAAGASITVPIASVAGDATATDATTLVQQELAANAPANSITGTGTLPAGIVITGSSALTSQGVVDPTAQGHQSASGANTGFFTGASAAYTSAYGYVPTEADVNTYNDYIWTTQDLTNWEAYVDNARALGYLNLAPMLSEFETVDFATSAATANVRAAALYSGGIAFDMPSWFFLAREPAYQQSIEAEIRWATQNGLRSSITLSPESGNDETFLADTQQVVAMLTAAGALPTQFVVKDGGVTGSGVLYSTTDPNSLNGVANYLSSLTLAPSNSESGLETRGTASRPDDLMTGVDPAVFVGGAGSMHPYAGAQLFAETKATTGTLIVTVLNASLGRLVAASGLGSVSANGTLFTFSGTMAQLTAALQGLSFVAAAGALGNAPIVVSVVDAAGTINGFTTITVDDTLTLSGVAATVGADGPALPTGSLSLADSHPSFPLTASVTLSNPTLAAFWNTQGGTLSADGATLTMSGTAATLQAFLRQLLVVPGVGASGIETETVSITDTLQTVSATSTITLAAPSVLSIGNLPVTSTIAPFVQNLPFQDLLLGAAYDPSLSLTISASLPSGLAQLVARGGGAVSADGLTFTDTGTAAQLQTALRSLAVTVPAGTTAGKTEALTLSLEGATRTVTLNLTGTDTVFVGAPDATEIGYASASIAAPLLAAGNIGLVDDYNGIVSTVVAGSGAALHGTWSGAAPGVFTFSEASGLAQQTITVSNTSNSAISVPVGTIATTAGGMQFQVVQGYTGNASWVAGGYGDGSLGTFVVAAGSTLTLTVEALTPGYRGNVAPNAITQLSGIAGATVTSSSPSVLATEVATGTVTLTNTSGSTVSLYEGTVLSNATGSYQIGNDPTAAGFVSQQADASSGYYALAPGATTTVPVYGINPQSGTPAAILSQILAQTTSATNTLSGTGLPSGVVVDGSSAMVVGGPNTVQANQTWGSWGPDTGVMTGRGFTTYVGGQGFPASEANINLSLATNFTIADLVSWDSFVDNARSLGMLNVAPVVSTPSSVLDISSSMATATLRLAALYGGGIDIDTTPGSLLSLGATAMTSLVDDIRWATQNGLRVTMTLRAYGDNQFLDETKSVLSQLQAAGALPSQVLVVGSPTSSFVPTAELAPAVAQYVAGLKLTPSTAESGLENTGAAAVDMIVTGVSQSQTTTGTAVLSPYAGVQLFTTNSATIKTATVALSSVAGGTLSLASGAGSVSADGSTVTLSGTAAQIDAGLSAIRYAPVAGAGGTATLALSISDAAGTIQGQTALVAGASASMATASAVPESAVPGRAVQDAGLAGQAGTASSPADTLIRTGAATSTVSAGLGDTISAGSGSVLASGTQSFQFLGGSSAADSLSGGAGGGSFTAGTGGRSLLVAGSGPTTLIAAGGNDTLVGGGHSLLQGAAGLGTVMVASGGDTVVGADGSFIQGPTSGSGVAVVQAGAGAEAVFGGGGAMSVSGGSGTLHVQLGAGQTTVAGGSGTETILVQAASHATLIDGAGSEIVSLTAGLSARAMLTLSGFDPGKDQIMLDGYGAGAAQALAASQVSSASETILTLSDGATITLLGLSHLAPGAINGS